MISPDRVILDIDDPNWSAAHGLARDFRSCTRTVAIGPTLFAAHGPAALQSFQELQLKLVVNVCMCTRVPRMLRTLHQFLLTPGVVAVSIMATEDRDRLTTVVDLAKHTLKQTHRLVPPAILARVKSTSKRQRRDIRQQTATCQAAGVVGVIAAAGDIAAVKSIAKPGLVILSMAERSPRDYRTRVSSNGSPGIDDLLSSGAEHVLLDSKLLQRTDSDWMADMATKEVVAWEKKHKPTELSGKIEL